MLYYRIIALTCLVLSFWAHKWLSPEWGWENSPIEWSQVVILAIGLVLSYTAFSSQHNKSNTLRYFGLFTTPCWLMLIGRELSWGRVFYPLNAVGQEPYFPPLGDLWFGHYIYPFNGVMMLIWLLAIVKYKLYRLPIKMIKEHTFPWADFLITLTAAAANYIAEKRLHLPITEEIAETLAFVGLIIVALQFKHSLSKHIY